MSGPPFSGPQSFFCGGVAVALFGAGWLGRLGLLGRCNNRPPLGSGIPAKVCCFGVRPKSWSGLMADPRDSRGKGLFTVWAVGFVVWVGWLWPFAWDDLGV